MRKILAVITLLLGMLPPFLARADEQSDAIKKIEKHLNSISSIKANFVQISADGGISNGQFFLSRPGRLRWQYEPPVPLLIIGNKGTIQYHDLELDTVSYVDMDDTLAGMMARDKISLTSSDLGVKNYQNAGGTLRLTLIKKDKSEDGSLTLVMQEEPLTLKKFEVVDGARQKTSISLTDVVYDAKLPPQLFEFETKQAAYPSKRR